jgi:hypothetical protein
VNVRVKQSMPRRRELDRETKKKRGEKPDTKRNT